MLKCVAVENIYENHKRLCSDAINCDKSVLTDGKPIEIEKPSLMIYDD